MLRIGFGAAGAVLVLASTASAVAAPAPSFNWTGLYVGANAGYDWSHGDIGSFNESIQQFTNAFVPGRGIVVVPGTAVPFPASSLSSNSFIGGGQVGYSFMSQNWVFGAEGDLHSGTKSAATSNSSDLPLTILQASARSPPPDRSRRAGAGPRGGGSAMPGIGSSSTRRAGSPARG